MFFQLVRHGSSSCYPKDDALKMFADEGFVPSGGYGGQHLREELRGQPQFLGLCGPMWGGMRDGLPVIRYETPEANQHYST